jgi:hypothetical protein
LSLFAIPGLRLCNLLGNDSYHDYRDKFYEGCLKLCPESCYYEKSILDVRSDHHDEGYTDIHTSVSDFSSLNISQIPKTDLFTFIKNVGGGLGLFMGIALPNLIEFLGFIVEVLSIASVKKHFYSINLYLF